MKQRELLFLLISVTFVAALWIVFNVIHNALTSTISDTTSADIKPISSTFDLKTLDTLKKRTAIAPQTGFSHVSPTPTPTAVPIAPITPIQFGGTTASQGGTTK